jgi:DNA polymerase III subunit gamma/tau
MATYQSLYRRYRSQRFDEVLGQDHITTALRNAVREGRVGHAYLFSGPRGTGKTSTARILAKVLNCAAPVDGEPCGKCENCVAVAEGRVVDWLLEQDAASKSKVDDMRDLLDRVPLGTSGNRKVIILDEVHMLSQGAENALLKTLEEPPAHVVFVLATTDPQKVRPTILSRTQHFRFRLLPPDLLSAHVRHVIEDAGLGIDPDAVDQAVDHVVRAGGGSARDALSALDQVAALGAVVDEPEPVDAILDALADREAGRVLVGVAQALAAGRDPRGLGETLIAALRDAFLALMGAADDHLAPDSRRRAAELGERFGAPGLTRALDVLGEALTELSRKPDPRIVVEVALVRLTQPSTDRTLEAVLERLDRLERNGPPGPPGPTGSSPGPSLESRSADRAPASRGARAGSAPGSGTGASGSGPAAPEAAAPEAAAPEAAVPEAAVPEAVASRAPGGPGAAAARDALTSAARRAEPAEDAPDSTAPPHERRSGQPTLGAVTRGRTAAAASGGEAGSAPTAVSEVSAPVATSPRSSPAAAAVADGPTASDVGAGEGGGNGGSAAGGAQAGAAGTPTPAQIEAAWAGQVLPALPVKIRSKWRGGRWIEAGAGGAWQFAVPNAWHQGACDEARPAVERALAGHFGHSVTVAVVVDGEAPADAGPGTAAAPSPSGTGDHIDEHVDLDGLRDADDAPDNGVELVLREFGGGQVVEEDQ